MKITTLIIENFKGIKDKQNFELRPITIFCGPNSSGKSSCIHALAALSQTMKLSNSRVPIVLDDEYAQVHLGRFIDVIHSKSMEDSFTLGIGINKVEFLIGPNEPKNAPSLSMEVEFKAKTTAQEIYIESAQVDFDGEVYSLKKNGESFSIKRSKKKLPFAMQLIGKFNFRPEIKIEKKSGSPNAETFKAFILGENVNRNINEALRKVLYLGPFRQSPLRRYPTRGSQPTEVGASGEAAVAMLANEFSKHENDHPNIKKISEWIANMGLGKKIVLSPVANTDLFDVSLSLDDGADLPLPDLGYGVSQVLPVLVQCSFAPKNAILLFEQPELHLHEGAARKLGSVFVDVVKNNDVSIIAETHSPHLVMEIINNVKNGHIDKDDFVLYDVCRKNGKSEFHKVLIEKLEDGSYWIEHPWLNGLQN